jgi:phytol kinase
MERLLATIARNRGIPVSGVPGEIQVELYRKSIHLLIAVVPLFAQLHLGLTIMMLGAGVLFYAYAEASRLAGFDIYIVSTLTVMSSRKRDRGHFVLGPVTLGVGAMLSLLLYPEPAASIAIFALAFGDGFSSLVGKLFGRIRIPYSGGKTVAGSLTCFVAVFVAASGVLGLLVPAIIIAATATLLEMLPTEDLDNIILPVGTGFIAAQIVPFFL